MNCTFNDYPYFTFKLVEEKEKDIPNSSNIVYSEMFNDKTS